MGFWTEQNWFLWSPTCSTMLFLFTPPFATPVPQLGSSVIYFGNLYRVVVWVQPPKRLSESLKVKVLSKLCRGRNCRCQSVGKLTSSHTHLAPSWLFPTINLLDTFIMFHFHTSVMFGKYCLLLASQMMFCLMWIQCTVNWPLHFNPMHPISLQCTVSSVEQFSASSVKFSGAHFAVHTGHWWPVNIRLPARSGQ